jgi:isochorismate hydrolase
MSEMLPAETSLMARARQAGVVGYGTREPNMSKWMPEIAPVPGDIKVVSSAQDRFYNTDLDKMLKAKGITTLILTGCKVSGSVAYTSSGQRCTITRSSCRWIRRRPPPTTKRSSAISRY